MGCKCANNCQDDVNKNFIEERNNESSLNEFTKNFNKENNLLDYNNNKESALIQESQNLPSQNLIQESNIYESAIGDYSEKIVEIINRIREDPVSYADEIENSIQYIMEEEDKKDPSKKKLIFKKKVKVALNKGVQAFKEAAEFLRNLKPLSPFEFSQDRCIPLPDNEDEFKDPMFLREKVKLLRTKTQVDVFFKDLIKIPDVSALLMIVDDTLKNPGKKRMALLNKELKYIGVTSKFVGKNFVAYFAFSK